MTDVPFAAVSATPALDLSSLQVPLTRADGVIE